MRCHSPKSSQITNTLSGSPTFLSGLSNLRVVTVSNVKWAGATSLAALILCSPLAFVTLANAYKVSPGYVGSEPESGDNGSFGGYIVLIACTVSTMDSSTILQLARPCNSGARGKSISKIRPLSAQRLTNCVNSVPERNVSWNSLALMMDCSCLGKCSI